MEKFVFVIYLGVELLSHMPCKCSNLGVNVKLFFKVVAEIFIPEAICKSYDGYTSSPTLGIVRLLLFC